MPTPAARQRAPRRLARCAPCGPGEDAAAVATRAADALEALLAERHDTIAAVIVEPLVQCATGMAMHDPAYLRCACARCATAMACT
jgi:adenosylmethionine-8-amino-7-oxononanoate aminotransferase